ncbi:MAG: translocation/assembly module TamB domain-containing protein [Chitinophagaceae bacterium]
MNEPTNKRNPWKRFGRIVLKTVLFLFVLVVVVFLLILTPPVQNFIRKKAVSYLENKLHTRVEVGRIYVGLPKKIVVEDIYIEDRQKDTLLSAGSVKVDMAIMKLIFKNKVEINSVKLSDITAKINRSLTDTNFNYQFIVDAFSPAPSPNVAPDTSSAEPLSIGSVTLDKARIIYKDVVSGTDALAWISHFDTKVDKFDAEKMIIDIPYINLSGLVTNIRQVKPLDLPEALPDSTETKTAINPQLSFGKVEVDKSSIGYSNDVSGLYTTANIGSLLVQLKKIDFANQLIDFDNISLDNTTTTLRLAKKEETKKIVREAGKKIDSTMQRGWCIKVASFKSGANNLQFDNDNLGHQATGMDYAHLKATPFTLEANDFLFCDDTIAAKITKAEFKEQSGFELQELTADFLYSYNEAYIHNLFLRTPGTELKREASIQYASLEALQNDIGNLRIDLDLDHSKVLVKDVLTFVPDLRKQPAFADPGTTWYINSRITGKVADLNIQTLQLRGLQDTKADIQGKITGLPSMDAFSADLVIRMLSSSRRDINLFLPAGTLPNNITLPSRMTLSGRAKGNTNNLNTELSARTDLGEAVVKGNFKQLNDLQKVRYDAVVQARSVDLGTILQDKENMGPVTATFTVNGNGFDPKTADVAFEGKVYSAYFKKYNYRDLSLKGTLANQKVQADASIMDPNIHFALNASADISKISPSFRVSGMIDSIKTQPLHLTPDPIIYRGKIDGDFVSADPDDLVGNLFLTQSLLVQNAQRIQLDTVTIEATRTENGHALKLKSDIANVNLQGKYKLTQLGNIVQQAIQPYFSIQSANYASSSAVVKEPYDFTLNAYVVNSAPLKVFVPGLERMDSLTLTSHFTDGSGWNANVSAPVFDYQGNRIRGLSLQAGTSADSNNLRTDLTVAQITSGSMTLYNTSLKAAIANNKIDFIVDTKDRAGKSRYNFAALFEQPQPGQYVFSFAPQGLLLNYEQWTVPNQNKITITSTDVIASNFVLSKSGQQISINSLSQTAGSPLQVKFDNFKLATVTAFVQSDSTLIDGSVNGTITFTDILRDPIFKGDLTINDLSIKNDTAGNATIHVSNTDANTYMASAVLSGRGNDVRLDGKYFVKSNGNSNFDLDLDIVKLPMTTAQAFSGGAIRAASGSVNGKFDITGTLAKPSINGSLNFDQAAFNITRLNNYFKIDQEKIAITEKGIRFDRFEIKDSLGNTLLVDGAATTNNFSNYNFDFTVRANNFQALNSTKKDNNLFYGQLFFNSNIRVRGTEQTPVIDGSLTVNEKTKMTIVLPQQEPGIVEREGVIEFVDMDLPYSDSLFLSAYDSLNTTSLFGFDITANIEVSKEAEFSLIIDEGNGDFLNVKGEASLSTGIDPSGKLTLSGSYELEEGSYELTFNFIKRKFNIDKGSKIIWLGEPTDADVDISATYIANVAPLDLVESQLDDNIAGTLRNTYLQKLPFDIELKMEGKLLKPQISFNIELPEDKNYRVSNDIVTNVRTKLDILRQEPGEMNKQVFAVLLLNRFIGENPFNSSTSDFNANTFARQSVSKLLTEQLNKLASDLIEGVDLNFDVTSSDDYTSGERRNRTDLNVGLSKQILNDRLSVSVGSNFELEGPQNSTQKSSNIAGNVALNYRVSKDGRYMLRAYRKNEYEGIIDGYIVETGVSFIISVDYNRFRQIFMNKEERQKRREVRKANREVRNEKAEETIKQQQPQP